MRKFRKSYQLKLTDDQLRDLLFVCDHVLFMEQERFEKWRAEGKDIEHHIYQKAVRALAKLESHI